VVGCGGAACGGCLVVQLTFAVYDQSATVGTGACTLHLSMLSVLPVTSWQAQGPPDLFVMLLLLLQVWVCGVL
jgi:hypothetical protein